MKLLAFLFKRLINGIRHEFDPDENGEYTYRQVKTFLFFVICGVLLLIFLVTSI